MKRFIEGADRSQWTLLPECLDDWVSEDNPVRASMRLLMHSILQSLASRYSRQRPAGLPFIPRFI